MKAGAKNNVIHNALASPLPGLPAITDYVSDPASPQLTVPVEHWIQLVKAQKLTIELLKNELGYLSNDMEEHTSQITSNFQNLTDFAHDQTVHLKDFVQVSNQLDTREGTHNIESIMKMINTAIARITQMVVESSKHCLSVVFSFEDLVEKFSKIEEFLYDINSINKQTNILALNAKIEAHRVGKHGAGFDVVANEVKQLAAMVQSLSESISVQINTVKNDLGAAFSILKNVAHIDMSENVTMKEKIDYLVARLIKNNENLAEKATEASEMIATEANQNLSEIIKCMQFQDRAKQQIENINAILQTLEKSSERIEKDAHLAGLSRQEDLAPDAELIIKVISERSLGDMRLRMTEKLKEQKCAHLTPVLEKLALDEANQNAAGEVKVDFF